MHRWFNLGSDRIPHASLVLFRRGSDRIPHASLVLFRRGSDRIPLLPALPALGAIACTTSSTSSTWSASDRSSHFQHFTNQLPITNYQLPTPISKRHTHQLAASEPVYCDHPGCWNNKVTPCWLRDSSSDEPPDRYYCFQHLSENGFCPGCGEFWGGVESFEFGTHAGWCPDCACEFDETLSDDED